MRRSLYMLLTPDGTSNILPVVDGAEYYTDWLLSYGFSSVYFEFYSDDVGTIAVTPTAGTITTSATPTGAVYLTAAANAVTQAVTVAVPDGTYTPPVFDGLVKRVKIRLSGITGAAYMRATLLKGDD